MPTRRATPLRQVLLMGSVTSKVLAGVQCPVFTGFPHGFVSNIPLFQSIVCAIDLGPTTDRVLGWASELASAFKARLTVVHAAPSPGEAAADYIDDAWRRTLIPRLEQRAREVVYRSGSGARVEVEAGPVSAVIVSVMQRNLGDLLVIGRGTSVDLLGRLRANAWDLIRQSPCPVLSV
jgi:nucleotide-binding universal stress UspA family protein